MSMLMRIVAFLSLALVFCLASTEIHSFDIFWQLQSGRYILETGQFIYNDIFSLAADAPRWEHCWLHDIIFFGAYNLGGYEALSLLKGIIVLLTGICLVAAGRARGASWVSVCLVTLPAFMYPWGAWIDRPQLWTFLAFSLFLYIFETSMRARCWLMSLWLVPIMIFWANLHAGAILAFPLLAAYVIGDGADQLLGSRQNWRTHLPYWLVAGLVTISSFITPYLTYNLKVLAHAPKLGSDSTAVTQIHNSDWVLTTFAQHPDYYYAVAGVVIVLLLRWRQARVRDLLLLGGLAYMGFRLDRHTPFFFMAAGVVLPTYLDSLVGKITERLNIKGVSCLRALIVVGTMVVLVWSLSRPYRYNGLLNTGLREWHYPVKAAEFVLENRLPGNLYNAYSWGGYLMWTLFPEYKVFWDGRSNSTEMFKNGLVVNDGKSGWHDVLDRYDVNLIVTKTLNMANGQRYFLLDRLKNDQNWIPVFASEASLVFVRRSAVKKDWLDQHKLPGAVIDDTILSEAKLVTDTGPWRYVAYWEMAKIHFKRKEYHEAFYALKNYLGRTRQPNQQAVKMHRMLSPMFQSQAS